MFLLFLLFQMICTRLNSNVSCNRWHQQSGRQVVDRQQIRPLTVRAPSAFDLGTECHSPPTVGGVIVDQNPPTLLGSNTTNAIQQHLSNGEDVHHHQAVNQHAPRQDLESVTSINQCDISKRNKNYKAKLLN